MNLTNASLCEAILDGDTGVMQQILEQRPSYANEKGPCNHLPLTIALMLRAVEVVRLLLSCGADVEGIEGDQSTGRATLLDRVFADASLFGKFDWLVMLLDAGLSVDFIRSNGLTLLMEAAYSSAPLTKLLLKRGANPNVKCRDGWTALMFAVETDQSLIHSNEAIEVMQALIASGAEVDVKNNDGRSAADILEAQDLIQEREKLRVRQLLTPTP